MEIEKKRENCALFRCFLTLVHFFLNTFSRRNREILFNKLATVEELLKS